MLVEVRNFHPYVKNTLQGFFDIYFHPFLIKNLTLHRTVKGKAWIGFPAVRKLDASGRPLVNEETGKQEWNNCVAIPDPAAHERFKVWCLKEVEKLETEASVGAG
jgi:hypothetical protein